MNCDPATLLRSAKCFCRLPRRQQRAVEISRLCQIVSGGGGGDTPIPPYPECDADAQAFITAAGITDETQQHAICVLVRDLKAYPAAEPEANRYWARAILIYPFVGGTAASHAVNLKNPGTNDLTFQNGVLHSAFGIQGVIATTARALTGWVVPPAMLNNVRTMTYAQQDCSAGVNRFFFGTLNDPNNYFTGGQDRPSNCFKYSINNVSSTNQGPVPNLLGAWYTQRQNAAGMQSANGIINWQNTVRASTATPTLPLALLAARFGANHILPTDMIMSSFEVGFPLPTDAERLEHKNIWDTYNTTLGRGHP